MTSLDNYCTHYCPDSGFSLISENDFEFEACNCFRTAVGTKAASAAQTDAAAKSSPILAEQVWYRTIAALAKVCGTAKPVQVETPSETPVAHENEEALARVRPR